MRAMILISFAIAASVAFPERSTEDSRVASPSLLRRAAIHPVPTQHALVWLFLF